MAETGGNGAVRVPAPPAAPPRLGLLASAQRPNLDGSEFDRLLEGLKFSPEACPTGTALDGYWWLDCAGNLEGDSPEGPKTSGSRPDAVTWVPYAVVEGDTCSTVGWNSQDYQGRARRLLIANQSRKMEFELWTGQVAQAAGAPNDWLGNPATAVELDSAPLVYALGELQQFAAENIGTRAMIHAQVRLVNLWVSAGVIRREGNLLLDAFDNIVVPGSGYDGSGPGSFAASPPPAEGSLESSWAYVTPLVQVIEEPTPRVTPTAWGEALDPSTNTLTFRAERGVLAYWDTSCPHAGILVDQCNPCCVGVD